MPKTPRAPAGARAVANQVKAIVNSLGSIKAAANLLNRSPSTVSKLLRSNAERKIGKAFHTGAGLQNWKDVLKAAKLKAPASVKPAFSKRAAAAKQPDLPTRAKTRAGKAGQDIAGEIKISYKPKEVAKASGESTQKTTARLQRARAGKATKEDRDTLKGAINKLIEEHGLKDGIRLITKEEAAILRKEGAIETSKGKGQPRLVGYRHLGLKSWDAVKKWVDNFNGGGSGLVRVVNRGTTLNPSYDVIIVGSDAATNEPEDEETDEQDAQAMERPEPGDNEA